MILFVHFLRFDSDFDFDHCNHKNFPFFIYYYSLNKKYFFIQLYFNLYYINFSQNPKKFFSSYNKIFYLNKNNKKMLMSYNNILKESLNIKKRNKKQKNHKEFNTALVKHFSNNNNNKNSTSVIPKFRKNKNLKKLEQRHTYRQDNSNVNFFDKAQNNLNKIIKREKSADLFKKKPSLRQKIHHFFNEFGYCDTNYINQTNKKGRQNNNNKLINNKNYNTLILFKKNKGETLVEKKRKTYFSPEKIAPRKKDTFHKKLLNLRTVSNSKFNSNINNNNDILLFKSINNPKNKTKNKSSAKRAKRNKNKSHNKKAKIFNNKQNQKKNVNILYKSQNLIQKIGLTPQKIFGKTILEKGKENEKNNNPLAKSTNINMGCLYFNNKNNNDLNYLSEKIVVNKNEENNCDKMNVKKFDSMNNFNNFNTNNSININLALKNEEICLTEENQITNKNINNVNIDNIKVCKVIELKKDEDKNSKNFKRNKSCRKPNTYKERIRDVTSTKKNLYKSNSKNKTPNKESLFIIKNFQNILINNNNNNNINSNINSANSEISYLYNIYYGNNGKLVEKVLKTRKKWEKIDSQNSQCANLIWTPLSCQINYSVHSNMENTQFVNHFEFHRELTNKANTFINLFRYCEFNDIDLFSFFPLTIILSPNSDYLQTQIEGFKRCYEDVPNLLYDINSNMNELNNSDELLYNNIYANTEENNNLMQEKFYINYFLVNLSKKIGTRQKIQIPKTFYIGKNLWLLKRTNLNRGREMKILSNIDEIIKEINSMFDKKNNNSNNNNNNNITTNKKQKLNNLIIQKYLESPLLYNGRKFDIRIWVLFTYTIKENNYSVYVFKEGHLKACSDEFNIDNNNLFIHLTNYSVQKYNKNFSKTEVGNEISFKMFQDELDRQKSGKNFKKDIFPEIIKIIWITARACKNKINIMERKNCFEIYGYDFILDTNFAPFLLEINTNPGLEESSPLIKMLVPRMIDDAFRLTIDKMFENGKNNGNDYSNNLNKSKFSVDGYSDEENMWQKIKKI